MRSQKKHVSITCTNQSYKTQKNLDMRMKWNNIEIRIRDKYIKYKNISYIYECKMADTQFYYN